MKKFHSIFLSILTVAILILALSAPTVSINAATHATLLESLQQQLNEIFAAVLRIQSRIEELLLEAAKPMVPKPADTMEVSPPAPIAPVAIETPVETTSPQDAAPLWKFEPMPSTVLTTPLAILYRFSITGGTESAVIPSIILTYSYTDVSVKNIEVFAFSDANFSVPTFLRSAAAYQNRVARYRGYLDSSVNKLTILFDQGPPTVQVKPGETYYFELRGTPVGKNRGAFLTISVNELSAITFE